MTLTGSELLNTYAVAHDTSRKSGNPDRVAHLSGLSAVQEMVGADCTPAPADTLACGCPATPPPDDGPGEEDYDWAKWEAVRWAFGDNPAGDIRAAVKRAVAKAVELGLVQTKGGQSE